MLDFTRSGGDPAPSDPAYTELSREGDWLILSSFPGDGEYGSVVVVTAEDVDALFRKFRARGLKTPGNPESPTLVHEGPIEQSWGTREFYVDDPDGNTIRFIRY